MLAGLDDLNKSQLSNAIAQISLQEEQPVDHLKQFRLKNASLVAWRPWGYPVVKTNIVLYGMTFVEGFLAFELDYPDDESVAFCNDQCGRDAFYKDKWGNNVEADPPYDTKHRLFADRNCKRIITLPPKTIASIRYRVTSGDESEIIYKDFFVENSDISGLTFWPAKQAMREPFLEHYPFRGREERFPKDHPFKSKLDDQAVLSLAKIVFNTLKDHPELRGSEHKKWPSPIRLGNVEVVNDDGLKVE
jgi:hypothetical protein